MNTIGVQSPERLADAFAAAPQRVAQIIGAALQEATLLVQREAQERAPTGVTGELRNSAFSDVTGTLDQLVGVMGFTALHAEPVELGTQPHTPPLAPLVDWVEARLGMQGADAERVARAIQFKIRARGTQGTFFVRDAAAATEVQISQRLQAAVANAIAEVVL